MSSAALVPLVAITLAVAFEAFCLYDLFSRTGEVRYLSRGAWAAITVISIPLGGIVYLSIGRGY